MRRDLIALGILLLFIGLSIIGVSRVLVRGATERSWTTVSTIYEEHALNLTVQANLTQGDRFQVYVLLASIIAPPVLSYDAGIEIYVTDPTNHTVHYGIDVIKNPSNTAMLVTNTTMPQYVANYSGTYRAEALGVFGIYLSNLSILKAQTTEKEPYYPYTGLLPVGAAVLFGGVGISSVGAKTSKRKAMRNKRSLAHKR